MTQSNSPPRDHGRDDLQDRGLNPEALSLSYEELFDSKVDEDGPCYLPSYVPGKVETDDGQRFNKDGKNEEEGDVTCEEGAPGLQTMSSHENDNATSDDQEKAAEAGVSGESGVADASLIAERKEDVGEEEEGAPFQKNDIAAQDAELLDSPRLKNASRENGSTDHKGEETGQNGYASPQGFGTSNNNMDGVIGITETVAPSDGRELSGGMRAKAPGITEIIAAGQDQDLPRTNLKHLNEDDSSVAWRKHKKHFFILSHAGKPIYSRYGDEHKLAGFSATLQAIMSFVENSGDRIKYVRAGDHQIVFLVKGPIYLVSISATDEPLRALKGQLELLHGQLLLILTKSLEKCYIKNANFDLRPLLGGTEAVFSSIIHSFSWNPASFLSSYTCLPLSHTARQAAGAALQDVTDADLLFALLLSDSKVISLVGAQKATLHPDDIFLLSNFVSSSESFKTTESFSPVCLPKYNAMAFLYSYVCYLDANTCLIMITKNSDAFFHLKESRARVESFLLETHVLRDIANSVARGGLRVEDLPGDGFYGALARSKGTGKSPEIGRTDKERPGVGGPAGLWHFIYRSIYLDQYVASEFSPPLHKPESQKRLYRAYQRLYASMHGAPAGSHQMQYRRDEHHVLLAWSTTDFEFFAAFDPLAEKSSAITVCNRVCQWIRDVENDFFFVGASPFNW